MSLSKVILAAALIFSGSIAHGQTPPARSTTGAPTPNIPYVRPSGSGEVVRRASGQLVPPYTARQACASQNCGELIYNPETKDVVGFKGWLTPRYSYAKDGVTILHSPPSKASGKSPPPPIAASNKAPPIKTLPPAASLMPKPPAKP